MPTLTRQPLKGRPTLPLHLQGVKIHGTLLGNEPFRRSPTAGNNGISWRGSSPSQTRKRCDCSRPQLHTSSYKSVGAPAVNTWRHFTEPGTSQTTLAALWARWADGLPKIQERLCRTRREVCSLRRRRLFHLRAAACRVRLQFAGDREPEWLNVEGTVCMTEALFMMRLLRFFAKGGNVARCRIWTSFPPQALRGFGYPSFTAHWSDPQGGHIPDVPCTCVPRVCSASSGGCLHPLLFVPPP